MSRPLLTCVCSLLVFFVIPNTLFSQSSLKTRFNNSSIYTGIEVGSKGVKMSVIEIGKNAQSNGAFNILKDTSVNTDFISFTDASFQATLDALSGFYLTALKEYRIPARRVYTVVSSGVKMQAEKDTKQVWVSNLVDSFRIRVKEPQRQVEVVDVKQEGLLSHIGIVPAARRYSTFLIDIGSGNTKGGFFPYPNSNDFKLFQLNWGTKSTANAADKALGEDKSITNYSRQLTRVLAGAEESEIVYAVNASGAFPVSDNIAVSGGIAWAVATLMQPDRIDDPVIPVTYAELLSFSERLASKFNTVAPHALAGKIFNEDDKKIAIAELKRVHKVFDQRSLMAGSGLLLKIMRQFETSFSGKQFFLVKNGQVGWVSAYVDREINKQ